MNTMAIGLGIFSIKTVLDEKNELRSRFFNRLPLLLIQRLIRFIRRFETRAYDA